MTTAAIISIAINILLAIFIGTKLRQKQRPALPSYITTKDELKNQAYSEVEREVSSTKKDLQKQEEKLIQTETNLSRQNYKLAESQQQLLKKEQKLSELERSYQEKINYLAVKEQELDKKYSAKFDSLTNIDRIGLEKMYEAEIKQDVTTNLNQWEEKKTKSLESEIENKARDAVALAVQRCSSEVANEHTLTIVELKNDDLKGNIIGKNGRNIQWLEKTLGVEIVVDETPGQVGISGFNSIRRHIAQKTLELLLEDGRVHPASIEEMYSKAKRQVQSEIMKAGNNAVKRLEITDFPESLVELIGRLNFRTSYGQNMLRHSEEMARLAKLLAVQINEEFSNVVHPIDVDICVKAALLHDIGKAMDEETIPKGNHVDLGEKICDRFDLDWRIRKCISSHHNEKYYDEQYGFCVEAPIVDACDNISGGRLSARKSDAEAYQQRLEKLETITNSIPGVSKSWIMNGNKELWVFFDTKVVQDAEMQNLVRKIAEKIETNTDFPTEVKVIGYWEDKVVEYAK